MRIEKMDANRNETMMEKITVTEGETLIAVYNRKNKPVFRIVRTKDTGELINNHPTSPIPGAV